MMVSARGMARAYTDGQPVSMLTDQFTWIGSGANPVIIFLAVAVLFHIALKYTRYGKYTYAIGANPRQPVSPVLMCGATSSWCMPLLACWQVWPVSWHQLARVPARRAWD